MKASFLLGSAMIVSAFLGSSASARPVDIQCDIQMQAYTNGRPAGDPISDVRHYRIDDDTRDIMILSGTEFRPACSVADCVSYSDSAISVTWKVEPRETALGWLKVDNYTLIDRLSGRFSETKTMYKDNVAFGSGKATGLCRITTANKF